MNIFGFGKRKSGNSIPAKSLHSQLGVSYTPMLLNHPVGRLDWFHRVQWPDPKGLDEFKSIRYQRLLKEFSDRMTGSTKWFSVCSVDEINKLFGIELNDLTRDIYENLRCLHCVHYENIPPHIVEAMPSMINAIFTQGESLTIIDGEAVRVFKTPKQVGNGHDR